MSAYIKGFKTPPIGKYRACLIVDNDGPVRLTVDLARSYADRELHVYPITPVPPLWISVEERMPKVENGECYSKDVYVTDGEVIVRAAYFNPDGCLEPDWTYTGIGKITHWCEEIPMPKPEVNPEERCK